MKLVKNVDVLIINEEDLSTVELNAINQARIVIHRGKVIKNAYGIQYSHVTGEAE